MHNSTCFAERSKISVTTSSDPGAASPTFHICLSMLPRRSLRLIPLYRDAARAPLIKNDTMIRPASKPKRHAVNIVPATESDLNPPRAAHYYSTVTFPRERARARARAPARKTIHRARASGSFGSSRTMEAEGQAAATRFIFLSLSLSLSPSSPARPAPARPLFSQRAVQATLTRRAAVARYANRSRSRSRAHRAWEAACRIIGPH